MEINDSMIKQELIKKECKRKQPANITDEQRIKRAEYSRRRHANITDEERLRRAECKRIRRANMTVEERKKCAEYKRKQYARKTEEQRMRAAERYRIQRANMSEDERAQKLEYYRRRYANMTEEERKARAEYFRNRRTNMTDERRKKRAEYDRRHRAKMTDEMRMKIAKYVREMYANVTEEQRLKRAQYKRERWANMTEEERKKRAERRRNRSAFMKKMENECKQNADKLEERRRKKAEYKRKRLANMTEEERKKIAEERRKKFAQRTEEERLKTAEYYRQRKANMTEEERIKIAEYDRKRHANMTEEMKKKRAESKRIKRAEMTKQHQKKVEHEWKVIAGMTEEGQLAKYESTSKSMSVLIEKKIPKRTGNSLEKLINMMTCGNMNVEIIDTQSSNLLQGIIRLIGIKCTSRRKVDNYECAVQNLTCKIDMCYLIKLLKMWDGWSITDRIIQYDALFVYLRSYFLNFKLEREKFLLNELKNLFQSENYISITCSNRQLQTLFYYNPQNFIEINPENIFHPNLSIQSNEMIPKYIIILPYISTRISLPHFTITHQNNHLDEYVLINMANKLDITNNKSFFRKQMIDASNSENYYKREVVMFLKQLRNDLITISDYITVEKKNEIIIALTIFVNDLSQCPDVIETNCKYNWGSAHYPYVRYLGGPGNGDICISMSDQKAEEKSALNLRLQQIRHPNITFILEKFNVSSYNLNQLLYRKMYSCISYKCLLCNEGLGSSSPSQMITDHFSKYHGLEPDWECTNCAKTFSNNYLLNNDWKHDCI